MSSHLLIIFQSDKGFHLSPLSFFFCFFFSCETLQDVDYSKGKDKEDRLVYI